MTHLDPPFLTPQMTPCNGCHAASCRRAFLLQAAAALAGLATGGELSGPQRAFALALDSTRPVRTLGNEAVYVIPAEDGVTIDRDHEIILARYQDVVSAFALSCPHQHTPLRWDQDGHRFQCPKHKSAFEPDGTRIEGRAERSMDRYALRRDGNTVVVDLRTVYQEDTDREKWAAAVVRL